MAFDLDRVEDLGVPDGSVGGILAWYSLIHAAPDAIPAVLAEFRRALAPGGGVLIGFFEGPELATFDHAVTPACYWPVGELAHLLEATGFVVAETHTRRDPGLRPHGALIAMRG